MSKTAYSNLKIFRHYEKLDSLKKGKITAPIYIRIKPINACNHKCYYCSYPHSDYENDGLIFKRNQINKSDMIPKEVMMRLIEDIYSVGVKAITFSGGGEPLIYPYIKEAIKELVDKKIDVSIITNGQNLKGDIAKLLSNSKWVRISMETPYKEDYSKIRRIPVEWFDEVKENIKNFAKIKDSSCELGINFVITKENYKQIYEMAIFAKSLGVNHIKFAGLCCNDFSSYHKDIKDEAIRLINKAKSIENDNFKIINKYESDFEYNSAKKRGYSRCYIMQIVPVVAADCKVYFCHDKAYDPKGVIGDLKENRFKDIWFSEKTKKLFESFRPDCDNSCNTHCTYDDRNILINNYLDLDENHINFI